MGFYKNMAIRKKLMSCFLAIAVLAAIMGGIGIFGIILMKNNENTLYREALQGSTAASGLYAVIVEQQLEIRGMIINMDDTEAVNQNISALHTREEEFTGLHNDFVQAMSESDEIDNESLKHAMDIYNGQFAKLKEEMISAFQSGDKEGMVEAYSQVAIVAQEATDSLFDLITAIDQHSQELNVADSQTASTLVAVSIAITVALVLLAVILGLYNAKIIAKPVSDIATIAQTLALGDVNANLSVDSKDEIGTLAKTFERMITGIQEQAVILNAISTGDYTVSATVRSDKDVMNKAINALLAQNNNVMGEIRLAASQVASGAQQIADSSQLLAQGATEQAANVDRLSSSINGIANKTSENADMALRAAELGSTIKNNAEKGSRQMNQMMSAVQEINEASQNINKVIKVIDDIAFQTNILALNAAVEAARAGQHGKGFAVVADEVRNLAAKSAEAAKDTSSLITNSMEKAELGARISEETAASLAEIVSGINQSSRIVGDIAKSSEEQAAAITQINQNIEQVAQVVQQNSATAEESASASEEMSGQAQMLRELIARFELKNVSNHYDEADLIR